MSRGRLSSRPATRLCIRCTILSLISSSILSLDSTLTLLHGDKLGFESSTPVLRIRHFEHLHVNDSQTFQTDQYQPVQSPLPSSALLTRRQPSYHHRRRRSCDQSSVRRRRSRSRHQRKRRPRCTRSSQTTTATRTVRRLSFCLSLFCPRRRRALPAKHPHRGSIDVDPSVLSSISKDSKDPSAKGEGQEKEAAAEGAKKGATASGVTARSIIVRHGPSRHHDGVSPRRYEQEVHRRQQQSRRHW